MKRVGFFLIIFLFTVSQAGFSDELINISSQKGPIRIDSDKLSSGFDTPAKADQADPTKSGDGLIGFGSDKTWQIHPGFDFKTAYDSNVNREPPGSRDEDFILSYIPSIEISRKGAHLEVLSKYEMNFMQFIRDADQTSFNHVAESAIKYNRQRLKVSLDDSFSWVTSYASSEQSERQPIVINDLKPEVAYRITPKFSLAAVYRNYFFKYKNSGLRENSYDINDIGGRIYFHATPKLDFYLHGSGNTVEYFYSSSNFDSRGYSVLVGSKGKLTKKVTLDLSTGYKEQHYKDSTFNSSRNWAVQGIVQYRLSRKTNIGLSLKREREESTYRRTAFYRSNAVAMNLSHKVTTHISIILDGAFQHNAYPIETTEGPRTKKRKDSLITAGARVNWKPVRYLTLSMGYGFRERASNFDNLSEYIDHTVDAGASCKF